MTSTQHSFQSPKPTHRLHPFTRQDRLFIVDLDVGQVLEADDLIWEILQLCPESTPGEILEALSEKYEPERIYQAFEQLHNFEEMGLLFGNTGQETLEKKNRLRIFVAGPIETWTSDKTYVRSGYRLASKEILSALSRYADLFFHAAKSEVISDGVYTLSGGTSRHNFLFQLQQNQIDGIFIPMIPLDMVEQMPLHLFSSGVPVISRLGSPRGHNGSMINSILWTYAAMNDHDAFITPTRSIKDFYAQHVLDTDCFHVIPNGVDSDLFRPMDKAQARSQVAEMLNFGVLSIEANEVIPFFSWNNVPTIVRANSGVRDEDAFINFVLAVYGAKRPFDAIVVDAPWLIHRFQEILSSDVDFCFLPDPVDLERFQPYQDKTIGRRCINAIFDTQEVFQKPVVGIIAGEAFEVNYRVGKFIAQLCPELFFVVFAPKLPDVYVNNLPSNLVFYTETEQFGTDPHLLPMLFNAMDICFFHASLQSSSSLLSQSLACGVPTLIGTSAAIPEFGNACAFIDSKRGITDREYLNRVLDFLKQLLADPTEMDRLSKDGRKLAESFSADAISAQFANLVHALTHRQIEAQAMSTYSSLPNLFCYHYDSNHGSVRSQALQHPHHSAESIEVGLAKELLNSHSRLQAETLLTEICDGAKERAYHILEKLSGWVL